MLSTLETVFCALNMSTVNVQILLSFDPGARLFSRLCFICCCSFTAARAAYFLL